ncbi:MAG: hypothetical protein AAGG56_16060 [Pseudomonadota bacterium]
MGKTIAVVTAAIALAIGLIVMINEDRIALTDPAEDAALETSDPVAAQSDGAQDAASADAGTGSVGPAVDAPTDGAAEPDTMLANDPSEVFENASGETAAGDDASETDEVAATAADETDPIPESADVVVAGPDDQEGLARTLESEIRSLAEDRSSAATGDAPDASVPQSAGE